MCSLAERRATLPAVLFAAGTMANTMAMGSAYAAEPGYYGYGTPATSQQIAGWDIDVRPDGTGLPPGSGSVSRGADVFAEQCAGCHGTFGEGAGRYPALAGGKGTLAQDRPQKTVGSFWPYAATLWDYINRAQPFTAPRSLSANDVYAVTAYILSLNDIVDDNFVADRSSLPKLRMPNRDAFMWRDTRPDTHAGQCMKDCVDPGRITIQSTAEGKDVTPRTSGPLDEMLAR